MATHNLLFLSSVSNNPLLFHHHHHHHQFCQKQTGYRSLHVRSCIPKPQRNDSGSRLGALLWPVVDNAHRCQETIKWLQLKSRDVVDQAQSITHLISFAHPTELQQLCRKHMREWLILLESLLDCGSPDRDAALLLNTCAFSSLSEEQANAHSGAQLAKDYTAVDQSPNGSSVSDKVLSQANLGTMRYLRAMVGSASGFIHKTPPWIKYFGGGFMLFYCVCFVWGCGIVLSGRMQGSDEGEKSEKDLRLSRIMRMKSEFRGDSEGLEVPAAKQDVDSPKAKAISGAKRVMEDDEELKSRILEIRRMARQARLAEQRGSEVIRADTAGSNAKQNPSKNAGGDDDSNLQVETGTPTLSSLQLANLAHQLEDVQRLTTDVEFKPNNAGESPIEFDTEKMNAEGNHGEGSISDSQAARVRSNELIDADAHQQGAGGSFSFRNVNATSGATRRRVKPRVIVSVEEAKARLAMKKEKIGDEESLQNLQSQASGQRREPALNSEHPIAKEKLPQGNSALKQESENGKSIGNLKNDAVLGGGFMNKLEGLTGEEKSPSTVQNQQQQAKYGDDHLVNTDVVSPSTHVRSNQKAAKVKRADRGEHVGKVSEELPKEELFDWTKDVVLREIVYKVRENELAGRDSFEGLRSDEKFLFYKGLEKKFQQEGKWVKNQIKEQLDSLDIAESKNKSNEMSEAYRIKPEGSEEVPNAEPGKKLHSDLIQPRMDSERRPSSPLSTSAAQVPSNTRNNLFENPHTERASGEDEMAQFNPTRRDSSSTVRSSGPITNPSSTKTGRSTITRSSRSAVSHNPTKSISPVITGLGTPESPATSSNNPWQHTKKWGKELQMKYDMETDPEIRALMKNIGKDLDRWITEEEIEEAYDLLSKGASGEMEYIKRNYERTRAKIKEQKNLFGPEAMVSKYKEYQPKKADELWWFDLPYVMCMGVQVVEGNEVRGGIYSLDISADLEGSNNKKTNFHAIAFQDRQDALNFCYFLKSQPAKVTLERVEIIPYKPKELYNEAKEEGFHVTVIRKGQLQLVPGKSLEEIEQRIIEIGSLSYWNKLYCDRAIDMNDVVKEGFGYKKSFN